MTTLTVSSGRKAPAFTLRDQDGEKVSLKDFAGQWLVVYFYPKDGTKGCTTEACEFSSALRYFTRFDAKVLGVSPDPVESHRKFIDTNHLKLTLLSDPDHKVLSKYGAWGTKSMYGRTFEGVTRSTVLIDPDGRIAAHWPKVKPSGHAAEVREKLKQLRS